MTKANADRIEVFPPDRLEYRGRSYRCVLGRGGVRNDKKEGDGATPAGTFPLRSLLFRKDRVGAPAADLPKEEIRPGDGWCDDPDHASYNTKIKKPFEASHEDLWREDHLYDVIVVLGYNDDPVIPGKGSAIFLHVAAPDSTPTKGCVALARDDLLDVLETVSADTRLRVHDAGGGE